MPTTIDAAGVRQFAAGLMTSLDRCDSYEGLECATLDAQLRHAAVTCRGFVQRVRGWAEDVFCGRAAFDPVVEQQFLDAGRRLLDRCRAKLAGGRQADASGRCYVIAGLDALGPAVQELDRLLAGWVRPALAVAPGPRAARPPLTPEAAARLAALPPLPADWRPAGIRPATRCGPAAGG